MPHHTALNQEHSAGQLQLMGETSASFPSKYREKLDLRSLPIAVSNRTALFAVR
jgi:hypothetical protein